MPCAHAESENDPTMKPRPDQVTSVTYDLATLTVAEHLQAHLRGRFPRSRSPMRRWIVSLLGLNLSLAILGFIVGMATWPRFHPRTTAIAFSILGGTIPVLTLSRVQGRAKRFRGKDLCTTELSAEGIRRQTRTVECKYLWDDNQEFLVLGGEVLLFLERDRMLWIPCRAFSSENDIESFLQTANCYYAEAMNRRRATLPPR
jgi:hypothetical protein